jgi:hypothetical protein
MRPEQEFRLWGIVFMAASLASMDAVVACLLAAGGAIFLSAVNQSYDDKS